MSRSAVYEGEDRPGPPLGMTNPLVVDSLGQDVIAQMRWTSVWPCQYWINTPSVLNYNYWYKKMMIPRTPYRFSVVSIMLIGQMFFLSNVLYHFNRLVKYQYKEI